MRFLTNFHQTVLALALVLPVAGQAQMALREATLTRIDPPDVSRSATAIVGDIDKAKCSAIAIGDNAVLTAARCVIDPKTGKPLPDRQVIAGIDLDEGYMPASRFFVWKIYIPDPNGPFGKAKLSDQPAVLILRSESKANHEFGNGSTVTGFHRTGVDPDPERLYSILYPNGKLSQMRGEGCTVLSIFGDGRMRLNCKMPQSGTGAPLLASTGIVGLYLEEGIGYYFGAAERADFDLIRQNYKPKHFIDVSNEMHPSFITVALGNECSRSVTYYLYYKEIGSSKGNFTLTTGKVYKGDRKILNVKTNNKIIYLAGQSGKKRWGRDKKFSGILYSEFHVDRYGDYFSTFTCN